MTLPETIMEVDQFGPWKTIFLYKKVLVSFHDCWREDICYTLTIYIYISNLGIVPFALKPRIPCIPWTPGSPVSTVVTD